MIFPEKLFITGTDTEIGKTFVSSMIMAELDATYWKPVQSGLEEETDTEFVKRVAGLKDHQVMGERYRLKTPMSPHASADIDDVSIDLSDFDIPEFDTRHLIIEGAGGLIVPINWEVHIIDLISKLDIPVLLVARSSLGTLNHTLLSVEALRNRDIEIAGIVLNGPRHLNNRITIEHFAKVPVFESVPILNVNKESLQYAFHQTFRS